MISEIVKNWSIEHLKSQRYQLVIIGGALSHFEEELLQCICEEIQRHESKEEK